MGRRATSPRPRVAGPGALAAVVAALSFGCAGAADTPTARTPETALPDLALDRIEGPAWNLRELAGQVVVLEFFATFDNVSIALTTALEQIHIAFQHRGVAVVGVAMDPPSTRRREEIVDSFCALNNLTFDVVLANEALGRGETAIGDVPVIPATVIFDRRGRPVASTTGMFNRQEISGLIEALVEGTPHPLLP
jgi:peroxiredoxin